MLVKEPPKSVSKPSSAPKPGAVEYKTFFYVFAYRSKSEPSASPDQRPEESKKVVLDDLVLDAFERLEDQIKQVKVYVNPTRYNEIRSAFMIDELPAFGITDTDISEKEFRDEPFEIPDWWKLWEYSERKEKLNSGKYLPYVERRLLQKYHDDDPDKIFFFIRDLHFINCDSRLEGVIHKIQQEAKLYDLKDLADTITNIRQKYLR